MDNQRMFLFFALAIILMMIWQAWEQERAPGPASTIASTPKPPAEQGVPALPDNVAPVSTAMSDARLHISTEDLARHTPVKVVTDLLTAIIDTQGGDLRELYLHAYPANAGERDTPFQLMRDNGEEFFIAQSGLIGRDGQYPSHKTIYGTEHTQYVLTQNQNELRVPFTWRSPDGIGYTKTYIFHRSSYMVDVDFSVTNTSRHEWTGYLYAQLQRSHVDHKGFLTSMPTYTGGAIYTPGNKYEKISFANMVEKPLRRETDAGWVAMLQHYFVGSWLLPASVPEQLYSDVLPGNRYVIGYKNLAATTIPAGQTATLKAQLYAGPKEHKILKQLPEGMELTVDFGWLTVVAAPLFWLLSAIHALVKNWGWAIIILTVLIKAVFYPLSATSYKSMAHMRKMQPKMAALKERYGDDRQKLNQAMMELYKTEKINPLGGCLPILVQIPVFIALYWVLLESVEMRQAPWILWIHDLSAQDPYYILPLIMGVSMFVQQKLNPQPLDPIQKKVFMVMPFIFTVFFLFFPAGLVLYWTVNNILSIAQQWRITQIVESKK